MAELTAAVVNMLFDFGVMNDAKNPDVKVIHVTPSGLGLPDREYYLNEGERYKRYREEYKGYIARLFTLDGDELDYAEYIAESIFNIERALAEIQMSQEDSQNSDCTYNKMTVAELEALTPHIPWASIFDNYGLRGANELIVHQVEYLQKLDALFARLPYETWHTYTQYMQVNDF